MKRLFNKYFEPGLFKKIALFYLGISILMVLRHLYMFKSAGREMPPFGEMFTVYTIDWIFVISFMLIVMMLTKWLLEKEVKWRYIFSIHLLLALTLSFLAGVIAPLVIPTNEPYALESVMYYFVLNIHLNILIYTSIALITYNYFHLRKIKEETARAEALENTLLQSKIKVLESQLEPHFLFNTLNSISSLITQNQVGAQNMVADLSSFLRKVLEMRNFEMITVEKEMTILEDYMALILKRFRDDLKIETQIDPDTHQVKIPGMLVQPLIENSIKHGYSLKHSLLKIKLSIFNKVDKTHIVVENDGKKMPNTGLKGFSGFGLSNVHNRLQAYYKEDFSLEIKNVDGGVKTEIVIPSKT
ncbi:histidine kinase [Galbibacter sp. EGI 63066]|uniref:sensor histidine kinase n=1 Tax=Galbibacter sp. EGI 63066 TaxID=2993559 RepID=UPI0022498B50|nr:histidine kinase [Galbibacter sp. EGI 63066]MCX2679799.1 histidine kinase [Galbibacter sp. EGI 63066]